MCAYNLIKRTQHTQESSEWHQEFRVISSACALPVYFKPLLMLLLEILYQINFSGIYDDTE